MGKGAPTAGQGMALSAGAGAVSGAITGTEILPGWGTLIGAIVGAALGAATAAIGTALAKQDTPVARKQSDIISTTTTRATPVAVAFGRNRVGGNVIAVGYFIYEKSHIVGDTSLIYRANYVVGLFEGGNGQLAFGNIRQDGQLYWQLAEQENVADSKFGVNNFYRFQLYPGNNSQVVPDLVAGTATSGDHGYFLLPHVPWRNTTLLQVYTIAGNLPRLPDINADMVGPDYTIRRTGLTTESNPQDQALSAFYDGYTESFYYTIFSSTYSAEPYGLVGVGRQSTPIRAQTQPPTAVGPYNITHGWYLGRHDVLVMQDPNDSGLFHIGWWGITPSDPGWEAHRPDAGYDVAINRWHLDEVHGILHTFHSIAPIGSGPPGAGYIMRWNLLTGRIERTQTNVTDQTLVGFIYAADMDCYVLMGESGMQFLDCDSGNIFKISNALSTAGVLNLCVCGQMIGTVGTTGLYYFDPFDAEIFGPYGTSDNDSDAGHFGGSWCAHQNTWTGHVTLAKNNIPDGNASLINFIPSVIEDIRDLNANGTSGLGQDPLNDNTPTGKTVNPEPDFQDFSGASDAVAAWIRDWSVRQTTAWHYNGLQGNGSLAAAMWATLVDEPCLDSKRWGAGSDPSYFSLASFESVHSYCVGGVKMLSPDGTPRRAERYKFDFMLDTEMNVGTFISDHCLLCCQGWRTTIGGVFHVGIPKPGQWPIWHFNDRNIEMTQGLRVDFIGRSMGVNRVRIQYRDVLTEYRHDFAEADNEWDQTQRNQIQQATISAEGCGRYGHADILAKAVLDQTQGGRRQTTHKSNFIAWLISAADPIEVSNLQSGLHKLPAKVVQIKEEAKDELTEFVCLEHRATMDALGGIIESQYGPGPNGSGIFTGGGGGSTEAMQAIAPVDGSISLFNGGAAFPPGDYRVTYASGTWRPSAKYNNLVAGFDVVSVTGGVATLLTAAPALTASRPGWPTPEDAGAANQDQTVTFVLTVSASIGLKLSSSGTALVSGIGYPQVGRGETADQTPHAPIYEIIPIASLGVPAGQPDPAGIPSSLHVTGYSHNDLGCTNCQTHSATVWNGILANETNYLLYYFMSLNHLSMTTFGHLTTTTAAPKYLIPGFHQPATPGEDITHSFATMWLLQCIISWQPDLVNTPGTSGWRMQFYCGQKNGLSLAPQTGVGIGVLVWEGELPGASPVGTYVMTSNSCAAGPNSMPVS